jgi:hypothetical protein
MRKPVVALLALCMIESAKADFMPPNNLHLQDNLFGGTGVTEQEFHGAIDNVLALYEPIIKNHGGKIRLRRYWKDKTVNASAERLFNRWILNFYGGLARRPEVTKDGFALVVCHEFGHHLGGFPTYGNWAADEGQSDYFATLTCGKLLWKNDLAENATFRTSADPAARKMCDDVYSEENDQNLCYRLMMGGYSLANLLANLNQTPQVSFSTPDLTVVDETYDEHPLAQCRLDTYAAGALCSAPWDLGVIPQNEQESLEHSCVASKGDVVGLRPRCWYKPSL